jgi:hypothetical protein
MNRTADESPDYLTQRVREALAHDPRLGELELGVDLRGDRLFVTGSVHTEERRAAIDDVVREIAPDLEMHNQVQVVGPADAAPDVETVS